MTTQRVNNSASLPPPTGGWNTRDPLSAMEPSDAITLENWFPDVGEVRIVPGFELHNSIDSGTGPVGTLAEFMGADGTRKLVAVKNNKFWDATTAGTSATDITGAATVTNVRWQTTNFRTLGNSYLIMCNGVDAPLYYTGSGNVAACAYTKATGGSIPETKLIHPNVYKSRLYFTEKDSSRVWYLPVKTATGAMANDDGFDFSSIFKKGGYILWTSTWSHQSSVGLDDYFIVMSNMGECLVYQGDEPGFSNWSLAAKIFFPPPLAANTGSNDTLLGRRSYFHLDSDLIIVTMQGAFSMRDAFENASGESSTRRKLTDKIQSAFNEAANVGGSLYGWEGIVSARDHVLLINAPNSQNAVSNQFGMNTLTGAWFKMTGKNASCWSLFKEELYYGGVAGAIYKGWTSQTYGGADIPTKIQTAFSFVEDAEHIKRFVEVKPIITVGGEFMNFFGIEVDYKRKGVPVNTLTLSNPNGTEWDAGFWDTFYWGDDAWVGDYWAGVDGVGRSVSIRLEGDSSSSAAINGFYIKYETGGLG